MNGISDPSTLFPTKTMIIYRNYNRTEHDDLTMNVLPLLSKHIVAVEIRHPTDGYIMAWYVKGRYE